MQPEEMKGYFREEVLLGLRSEGGVNVEMSQEKREVLQKWYEIAFDFNFPTCNLWLCAHSVSQTVKILVVKIIQNFLFCY